MIPSLFTFTLLAAAALLLAGLPLLVAPGRLETCLKAFPRHRALGVATLLLGGGWFLWKILNLGQSDFGDYRHLLFLLFAATLLGSIFYVQDFLAVRGVAILLLLLANVGLKSAYALYDIPERLVLVSILYALIIAAVVYGIMPYRMRDTLNWLYGCTNRVRALGLVFSLGGVALLLCAFLY